MNCFYILYVYALSFKQLFIHMVLFLYEAMQAKHFDNLHFLHVHTNLYVYIYQEKCNNFWNTAKQFLNDFLYINNTPLSRVILSTNSVDVSMSLIDFWFYELAKELCICMGRRATKKNYCRVSFLCFCWRNTILFWIVDAAVCIAENLAS